MTGETLGVVRAREGGLSEIGADPVAYPSHEPPSRRSARRPPTTNWRGSPRLLRHRPTGEGAEVLRGGKRADLGGELSDGYYVEPTIVEDADEALAIADDTLYGLGAGVWARDGTRA